MTPALSPLPSATDFNLAKSLLQHYHTGLRAGDALHVAIAQNHSAITFCTLDKELIKIIKQLKISIDLIGINR